MPHILFGGRPDLAKLSFSSEIRREGRVVMKIEKSWLRSDGRAVLVEGVVVEYSRALHPVAVVTLRKEHLSLQFWPPVPLERNEAVQRWLIMLAEMLQGEGAGLVIRSNLPPALLKASRLKTAPADE